MKFRAIVWSAALITAMPLAAFCWWNGRGGQNAQARTHFAADWAKMAGIVPQNYVCYHTTGPIKVDALLSEPDWQKVPWTQNSADIEGDAKPKPRFRTHVKMLWDDEYLYIAAEMEEPHVWGTLTQHDSVIFNDNDFEVFIDPNSDSHEYYEIEINALNTEWDLFLDKPYKDQGKAHNEWEIPGLKTAVHVDGTINNPADTDKGWTVEFAFPWKALGEYAHKPVPPVEADQWRIDFSRVEWEINIVNGKYVKVPGKREDNWIWSPIGIVDMHRPEKWGYLQFTRKPFGEGTFVPDPTMPARNTLQGIYYSERDYQARNQHWTGSLADLALPAVTNPATTGQPTLKLTPDGFVATVDFHPPGGEVQHWHIRQDALVWKE